MSQEGKNIASKKILERIRALLAMGSDTSSEHEADIAMRRARKLMDEHQITLLDIDSITSDDFGSSTYDLKSTRQKTWISTLVIAISEMNDCVVDFAPRWSREQSKVYLFQGFKEDVKLCEFMVLYLVDTCTRLYERDKSIYSLSGLADKNNYLLGAAIGLEDRMKEITAKRKQDLSQHENSRSLTVVKNKLVKERFGAKKHKTSECVFDGDTKAYDSGRLAADGVQLGNFLNSSTQEVFSIGNHS